MISNSRGTDRILISLKSNKRAHSC